MKIIGELFQTIRLTAIQRLISLGVVADQYFAERGMEGLDVRGKLFAVFKFKLVLSALFSWTRESKALLGCVAKNGSPELFVDQDADLSLGAPLAMAFWNPS